MIKKIKQLFLKLYNDRRIRFLFVGCLNTVVGTGTTLLMYVAFGYGIFEQSNIAWWETFVATIVGYAVGTVHSYLWNKFFTFKSKEKSFAEFLRFVCVCVVQYGVNFGLTTLAKKFIDRHLVYTIIVTIICMIISFAGHSLFSFGKRFVNDKDEKEQTEEVGQ